MIEQLKRVIKLLDNLSKLSSDNHSTFTRKELKTQFSNYDLSKMEKIMTLSVLNEEFILSMIIYQICFQFIN